MNVAALLSGKGRDVVTASPDTSLTDVAKLLAEHRIGSLVIVDEASSIEGIISERDIVRLIAKDGPAALDRPVSSGMIKDVVTCQQGDTVDYLMSAMTSGRFRHMPVVKSGRLVGLVSIGDVVKHHIEEVEHEAEAMRHYIAG